MKKIIKTSRKRKSITLLDNIVYSKTKDKDGNDIELCMSLMLQHGNVESRLANGIKPEEYIGGNKHHVLLWIPGGGYRGTNKNLMVPEMTFLAELGYAVAFVYYRGSGQAQFPAQIIDVKTAIRFLRANADKYNLDTKKIGIMGRSAGGHLAALAGMNLSEYETQEWSGYSSKVDAVCDWFGPVDMPYLLEKEVKCIKENSNYRWKSLEETHPGALLGGDTATMIERSKKASPPYLINKNVCPMLIMHGDIDRHVPVKVSENFYEKLVEAGFEEHTDFYILEKADHGSDDFFDSRTKEIMVNFFNKYIKE